MHVIKLSTPCYGYFWHMWTRGSHPRSFPYMVLGFLWGGAFRQGDAHFGSPSSVSEFGTSRKAAVCLICRLGFLNCPDTLVCD